VVEAALRGFVDRHQALLGIDVRQLGAARVTQVTEDLWQVYIPQAYEGVPVRYGALVASISHGNLVTIGTDTWGDVTGLSARPEIPAEAALATGFAYTEAVAEDVILEPARLDAGDFGNRRDAAKQLVVVGDLLDALGTHASAAQHIGEERTNVGEALRTAERHDQDGIEAQNRSLLRVYLSASAASAREGERPRIHSRTLPTHGGNGSHANRYNTLVVSRMSR